MSLQFIQITIKYHLALALFIDFIGSTTNSAVIIRKSRQDIVKYAPESLVSAVLNDCSEQMTDLYCKRKLFINIRINPTGDSGRNHTYVIIDEVYNAKTRQEEKLVSPYLIEIRKTESILTYPLNHTLTVRCNICPENKRKDFDFEKFKMKEKTHDRTNINDKILKKFQNNSGPVDYRPKIKKINRINNMKTVNRNELPEMRKLPSHPIPKPIPELEIEKTYNNLMLQNRIPFSPDLEIEAFRSWKMYRRKRSFSKNRNKNEKIQKIDKKSIGNKRKFSKNNASARANYDIYNINNPLPLLIAEIRIFQRKSNKWFKMGPSFLLSTLSTANNDYHEKSNISIVLSSNDELFPLKRQTALEKHKLLIPAYRSHVILRSDKRDATIKSPKDSVYVLKLKKRKRCTKKLRKKHGKTESSTSDLIKNLCALSVCKGGQQNNDDEQQQQQHIKNRNTNINDEYYLQQQQFDLKANTINKSFNFEIFNLDEYDNYSKDIADVLQKCEHDQRQLCLNMLDNEFAAYSVKIQFPFHQNALIPNNYHKVRIRDILSDATATAGILQVTANIINIAFFAHEYIVTINKCHNSNNNGVKGVTEIKQFFYPNVGEKVDFHLELMNSHKVKEFTCTLYVKIINKTEPINIQTIAKRQFYIKRNLRCICVWHCDCICLKNNQSKFKEHKCRLMKRSANLKAGFNIEEKINDHLYMASIIFIFLMVLIWALLLGLIKAIIGICSLRVRMFGLNLIFPDKYITSKRQFFCLNIFFFILILFVCCRQQRKKSGDEEKLLPDNYWEMEVVQHKICDSTDEDKDGKDYMGKAKSSRRHAVGMTDDDEETILSQRFEKVNGTDYVSSNHLSDIEQVSRDRSRAGTSNIKYGTNTADGHAKTNNLKYYDIEEDEATQFVHRLLDAKIVYKIYYRPIGGVETEDYEQYSMRGYFIIDAGKRYKFITPIPTRQYYRIITLERALALIKPPLFLNSKALSRTYANRKDVYRQADLFLEEPDDAPCLNYLPRDLNSSAGKRSQFQNVINSI